MKQKMIAWLKAGGFWAEAFKQILAFAVFGLLFIGAVDYGPKSVEYVANTPSRMAHNREKMRVDAHQLKVITEAKRAKRDVEFRACEIVSETRGALIKCLSKIEVD